LPLRHIPPLRVDNPRLPAVARFPYRADFMLILDAEMDAAGPVDSLSP